jgi:uncharacterized RDD family membrane protein YckC
MEDTLRLNLNTQVDDEPPDTAQYVGFWPRAAARVIDTVLHWLLAFVVGFASAVYFLVLQKVTGRPAAPSLQLMRKTTFTGLLLSFLGFTLYGSILEGLHGSTVGKRLLGMVVLRESKTPCDLFRAAGRWLATVVDLILFGAIGYYAMGTNKREQRYGDLWCGTVVVRRSSVPHQVLRSNVRFVLVMFLAVVVDLLFMLFQVPLWGAG